MDDGKHGELIELRVENVAQIFHTLDPFPFRERDLDREGKNSSSVGLASCPPAAP